MYSESFTMKQPLAALQNLPYKYPISRMRPSTQYDHLKFFSEKFCPQTRDINMRGHIASGLSCENGFRASSSGTGRGTSGSHLSSS